MRMGSLGLALCLGVMPVAAYTIVKTDGTRFQVKSPPEYKDGRAVFLLPGGSRGFVPEAQVDKGATEKANAAPAPAPPKAVAPASAAPRSPGSVAPGGKGPSSFTDTDLPKRRDDDEEIAASPGPPSRPEGAKPHVGYSEEGIARHEEDMARRDRADGDERQLRIIELERRVSDLRQEFLELHERVVADSQVDSAEIEEEKRKEAEIREAEQDLSEARQSAR